ncbi:MAG TPA: Uma2 family endonuclease [Polyangiaceae bacterium]|nr:Uma2 family endonuclease [Polyangiaceae bacterium]
MADPAKRRATYEDLLAAPEHTVAELIDGELHTHPRPASQHARAATRLTMELGGPFDRGKGGPGGWILLDEPELHFRGGDVLVPDLAGWRRERMPELPIAAAFELAPDWACEVLSPATAALDRTVKMGIYAREQVRHVWLVDPVLRTLEVFRLLGKTYEAIAAWHGELTVRAEPFEAIDLELAILWEK